MANFSAKLVFLWIIKWIVYCWWVSLNMAICTYTWSLLKQLLCLIQVRCSALVISFLQPVRDHFKNNSVAKDLLKSVKVWLCTFYTSWKVYYWFHLINAVVFVLQAYRVTRWFFRCEALLYGIMNHETHFNLYQFHKYRVGSICNLWNLFSFYPHWRKFPWDFTTALFSSFYCLSGR